MANGTTTYQNYLDIDVNYHLPRQPYWEQATEAIELNPQQQLFAAYLPEPQELNTTIERWRSINWGCESDPIILGCDRTQLQIKLFFESENNPPLVGVKELSKLFPTSEFHYQYSCRNLNIRVVTVIKNGEALTRERFNYFGRAINCEGCNKMFRPEINLQGDIIDLYCRECRTNWSSES